MSRASQDIGDSGDRRQDCNIDKHTRLVKIKLHEAGNCDLKTTMPRALAEQTYGRRKHRESLLYEFALLWRRFVQDGDFRVSMGLLDELYTSHFRRAFKEVLDATATPVKTHSSFAGRARSRTYKFKFQRPKKTPTYSDIPEDEPDGCEGADGSTGHPEMIRVTVSGAWLFDRYERWTDVCERNGWTSSLDLDGRTDWGRPLFAGFDKMLIPEAAETTRLVKQGVVKIARRKRGRCYHPLTNLRKDLRRKCLIDGEPTAEVDIHACYTALLISKMPDGEAKDRAIAVLKTDWYAQFKESYAEWFRTQVASGRGYINEEGLWMLRLDDNPEHDTQASIKVEYQRQCLFWRDPRDESNPLRLALRRLHPELCYLIEAWRKRMTPTELSDVLTRAEGTLVVDFVMAELERAGINAISIHDAVVVRASRAEDARKLLLGVCEWYLGFEPRVSDKVSKSIVKAL